MSYEILWLLDQSNKTYCISALFGTTEDAFFIEHWFLKSFSSMVEVRQFNSKDRDNDVRIAIMKNYEMMKNASEKFTDGI